MFRTALKGAVESDGQPVSPAGGGRPGVRLPDLDPGQYVGNGRYELKRLLGQGGMGVVWLAEDLRLDEAVALKFLPLEIRNDVAALHDMRREVLKSHKLSHPHILRIHDLFEGESEAPFISMQFVDGANLGELSRQQPRHCFTWEYLQPLVRQLCDALEYAHGEGVIHRDLKPANMMLDSKGRLKLADFGIATVISDSRSGPWVRHATAGTWTHMSPQQMDGAAPKATDDLYALGASLYELLTSRPPFYEGDIPQQVRSVPAKPLEVRLWELGLENEVPPEVSAMILACLAKDPEQRPQTARAVREWIMPDLTEQPLHKAAVATMVPAVEQLAPPMVPPSARGRSPLRKLAVGAGIAALLAAVIGVGWWLRQTTSDHGPSAETAVPKPSTVSVARATESQTGASPPLTKVQPAQSGSLDTEFNAGAGPDNRVGWVLLQYDGRILIGGHFTKFNGVTRHRIARLKPDGTVDPSFDPGKVFDNFTQCALVQPDGKILVGGHFDRVAGRPRRKIARLNPDGSFDPTFQATANREVRAIAIQPDGRILLGGIFTVVNGQPRNGVARLEPDGTLDDSFKVSANKAVLEVVVLPNGKCLIAGNFTAVGGLPIPGLARLLPDGSVDGAFVARVTSGVTALAVLADGRFVAGALSPRRFQPQGRPDEAFDQRLEVNQTIRALAILPDDRLVLAGEFTVINARACNRIALLKSDGTLDPRFALEFGASERISDLAVQPDGQVVIVGDFRTVNGTRRNYLARLYFGGNISPTR